MMDQLQKTAQSILNLQITPVQLRQFQTYADDLMAWNAHTNLTAIIEPDDVEIWHFMDSLTPLKVIKQFAPGVKVIDVGTGGGFPGLPLKIICPHIHLTMVESTGKKVDFLRHIVDTLALTNVTLVNERAEAIGQHPEFREQYDWVLARAVASLPTLVEYLLPLTRIGGRCLPQKGESAAQEASEAQAAIKTLGGHLVQLTPYELPTITDTRYLVNIEKVAPTPPKYPRRPGMPNKRPIT